MKKHKLDADSIRTALGNAMQEWFTKRYSSPESIRRYVFNKLDQYVDEVIMSLLGFRQSFGDWDIDRTRDSTIRSFLDAAVKDGVEAWLLEQLKEPPSLSAEAVRRLRASYQEQLYREVYDVLHARAADRATEIVEGLLKDWRDGLLSEEAAPPMDAAQDGE